MGIGACYPTRFSTGATSGTTHSKWSNFFIFGLAGTATVDAAALCPSGIAGVETYASFGQAILHVVTFGLYSPRTVEITCAAHVATTAGIRRERVYVGQDLEGTTLYVARRDVHGAIDVLYRRSGGNR